MLEGWCGGVRLGGLVYLPRLPPPRPPPPRPPPEFPIWKPRGNENPDPREPPLVKPRWLGGLLGPGGRKLDSAGMGCPCSEPDSKEDVDSDRGLFWFSGGRGGTTGVAGGALLKWQSTNERAILVYEAVEPCTLPHVENAESVSSWLAAVLPTSRSPAGTTVTLGLELSLLCMKRCRRERSDIIFSPASGMRR